MPHLEQKSSQLASSVGISSSAGVPREMTLKEQLSQMATEMARLSTKAGELEKLSKPSKDTSSVNGFQATNVIELNIGGTKFQTTRETLTKVPGSFFETLLSEQWSPFLDRDGCIFIDRDPRAFGCILNYLRDYPRVTLNPYDLPDDQYKLLCEDANFYLLPTLTEVLEYVPPFR